MACLRLILMRGIAAFGRRSFAMHWRRLTGPKRFLAGIETNTDNLGLTALEFGQPRESPVAGSPDRVSAEVQDLVE